MTKAKNIGFTVLSYIAGILGILILYSVHGIVDDTLGSFIWLTTVVIWLLAFCAGALFLAAGGLIQAFILFKTLIKWWNFTYFAVFGTIL